jgi:hypothetical protein
VKKIIIAAFCLLCAASVVAQTADSTNVYTAVHYKGNAFMGKNDEYQGCQYNVVSVIDSFLYVQLNFAGIEAGKVLATPSNLLFINKIQKNFYAGDYSVFERVLNMEIDFYMLQNLFNGALALPPEGVELYYETDSLSHEYPFFKTLTCNYEMLSLEVNVRKVTFNKIPDVSAVVPKNYRAVWIEGR